MKRTRKKHNAVIKAKGWWWRRSGGPDGAESVFEGGGGARACRERGVAKSVGLLTGVLLYSYWLLAGRRRAVDRRS